LHDFSRFTKEGKSVINGPKMPWQTIVAPNSLDALNDDNDLDQQCAYKRHREPEIRIEDLNTLRNGRWNAISEGKF
jgi:hypothetical protein